MVSEWTFIYSKRLLSQPIAKPLWIGNPFLLSNSEKLIYRDNLIDLLQKETCSNAKIVSEIS